MKLYTAGYRDSETEKRLSPEAFYGSLPEEAVVVDIRSHPYSPFAPDFTGSGVGAAVSRLKPGVKTFHHLKQLGNTHKEPTGKRRTPPVYVDEDAGFQKLEEYLGTYDSVVIFCACSYITHSDSRYRCHRFFVADRMAELIPKLEVIHLQLTESPTEGP
jgi:hypothetical protein